MAILVTIHNPAYICSNRDDEFFLDSFHSTFGVFFKLQHTQSPPGGAFH